MPITRHPKGASSDGEQTGGRFAPAPAPDEPPGTGDGLTLGDSASVPETTSETIRRIVAADLGAAVVVEPVRVNMSDGYEDEEGEHYRWHMDGWAVTVDGERYEIIPPEGDSHDAWLGADLEDRLSGAAISDLLFELDHSIGIWDDGWRFSPHDGTRSTSDDGHALKQATDAARKVLTKQAADAATGGPDYEKAADLIAGILEAETEPEGLVVVGDWRDGKYREVDPDSIDPDNPDHQIDLDQAAVELGHLGHTERLMYLFDTACMDLKI